ncbi:hypothetical protein [Pseudomonas plecoglossicida]
MALKLNERYPGRFDNPSTGYPQGSFKNRTTPTSKDGSYLEKDWANDKEGFFQSLIASAGLMPSGAVDKVGASQYFDALRSIIASPGVVIGRPLNAKMAVTSASASATLTADEIAVSSSLGAVSYTLANFNKTINLATTGAGGMDTGTATANGFVAIYAIYNPATGASALLAANANSAVAPEVYGGANMPAGYTASALVSIAPISGTAGQFAPFFQLDRSVDYQGGNLITGSSTTGNNLPTFSTLIPINAKFVSGTNQIGSNAASAVTQTLSSTANNLVGGQFNAQNLASGTSSAVPFRLSISVPQTIYRTTGSPSGTPSFTIIVRSYEF